MPHVWSPACAAPTPVGCHGPCEPDCPALHSRSPLCRPTAACAAASSCTITTQPTTLMTTMLRWRRWLPPKRAALAWRPSRSSTRALAPLTPLGGCEAALPGAAAKRSPANGIGVGRQGGVVCSGRAQAPQAPFRYPGCQAVQIQSIRCCLLCSSGPARALSLAPAAAPLWTTRHGCCRAAQLWGEAAFCSGASRQIFLPQAQQSGSEHTLSELSIIFRKT